MRFILIGVLLFAVLGFAYDRNKWNDPITDENKYNTFEFIDIGTLRSVEVSGVSDNDILTYDAATETWTAEAAVSAITDTIEIVGISAEAADGILRTLGGADFNRAGEDFDFKFRSNTVENALFIDGATGKIGVGTSLISAEITISKEVSDGGVGILIQNSYSFEGSKNEYVYIDMRHKNENDVVANCVRIDGGKDEDYNGNALEQDGMFVVNVAQDGALIPMLEIGTTNGNERFEVDDCNFTFNQDGGDFDFKIESDGIANMFVVDGTLQAVGIGTDAPKETLEVIGTVSAEAFVIAGVAVGAASGTISISAISAEATTVRIEDKLVVGHNKTPLGVIHLQENSSGAALLWISNNDTTHNAGSGAYLGFNSSEQLVLKNEEPSDTKFVIGANTPFLMDSGGNVGIGTAIPDPPAYNLHLAGGGTGVFVMGITNATTGHGNNDGGRLGLKADETIEFLNQEATSLEIGTNNTVCLTFGTDTAAEFVATVEATAFTIGGTPVGTYAYIKITDTKAYASPDSGDFNSGAWQSREINTEDYDSGNNCTINATNNSYFTLEAGTYIVSAKLPALKVNGHVGALYNLTASDTIEYGTPGYSQAADIIQDWTFINGRFTIGVASSLEFRHRCVATKAANGFGNKAGIPSVDEKYTTAEFWKE